MAFAEVQLATERMEEVIERLAEAFGGIHTGRASTALVEKIQVTSYGQSMPLKAVASITVPEPTQIAITPWDKGQLVQIEAAIREAEIGVSPVNDGNAIRLTFPPLTQERREQLVKQLKTIAEEARVALRTVRHEQLEAVKKDAETTEDDKFQATKAFDKLIDEFNGKIEAAVKTKEAEILKV
ncbi:ribosome recycling factor [Candidatus Berkelbacteria bacterium]|nr:ribosome recycling factor [Candidatus Berkelbacteria bacterium]